jgi:hypothetical protein
VLESIRSFYRAFFRRRSLERDMQDEMAAHLEQAVERLTRRGLSSEAARELARREFGNVAFLQEQARDARGGHPRRVTSIAQSIAAVSHPPRDQAAAWPTTHPRMSLTRRASSRSPRCGRTSFST